MEDPWYQAGLRLRRHLWLIVSLFLVLTGVINIVQGIRGVLGVETKPIDFPHAVDVGIIVWGGVLLVAGVYVAARHRWKRA